MLCINPAEKYIVLQVLNVTKQVNLNSIILFPIKNLNGKLLFLSAFWLRNPYELLYPV